MRTVLIASVLTLALAANQAWKRRANRLYGSPAAATLPGAAFLFGLSVVIGTMGGLALRLVLAAA